MPSCGQSVHLLDYRELMTPILQSLADHDGELTVNSLIEAESGAMGVFDGPWRRPLPSGRETVMANRMLWALAYLEATGMVATTAEGTVRLCEAGAELLARQKALPARGEGGGSDAEEMIQRLFQAVHEGLKAQLIARIHAMPPAFFEDLIVDLLLAMGYGGRRRDLAAALGRSCDGGIDGIVRQDLLGLDVVYVQAKRYRPGAAVPIAAVRDFAGTLDAHKADKGVMVTTSHFPRSAAEFARASHRRIALVDGPRLASLLIRHNIAVRPHVTYELKCIDEGYFAAKPGTGASGG